MASPTDQEAIRQIDSKISVLQEQIRKLRAERNTKLAIMHLPVEILTHVFTFCVPKPGYHPDPYRSGLYKGGPRRIRWISFTHVCRTWRSLALDCPTLWTYPDLLLPALAQAMVERSRFAAIDVHIQNKSRTTSAMLSQLEGNLPRIRTLSITVSNPLLQGFVSQLVLPAPTLLSLKITNAGLPAFFLPSQFLRAEAPLLTEIRLDKCYLPWSSSLLNNITLLSLVGDNRSNISTGSQFLGALQRICHLQVLELEGVFPETINRSSIVHLPHLRRLSLNMSTDNCTNILNHVTFPDTTSLILRCFPASGGARAFSSLFACLSRLNSGTSSVPNDRRVLKTLAISFSFEDGALKQICLTGWNVDDITFPADSSKDSRSLPSPNFKLVLDRNDQRRPLQPQDVTEALDVLHLKSISTLLLDGQCNPDENYAADNILFGLLGDLPWLMNVKTLILRDDDFGYHGAEALGEMTDGCCTDACFPDTETVIDAPDADAEPHVFAFPALETLVLLSVEVNFKDNLCVRTMLVHSFASRWRHGVEMPNLVLKSCYSRSGDFEDLKGIFVDVVELDSMRNHWMIQSLFSVLEGNLAV